MRGTVLFPLVILRVGVVRIGLAEAISRGMIRLVVLRLETMGVVGLFTLTVVLSAGLLMPAVLWRIRIPDGE